MSIDQRSVAALAPDQASLAAAGKLLKPGSWPLLAANAVAGLIWGECQGSGANPYRVVFDLGDGGYKCTCPSRKFPCKHTLALMLMYVRARADFGMAEPPPWIGEWMGRRRRTSDGKAGATAAPEKAAAGSTLALPADGPEPPDAEAEGRRAAARARRAAETDKAVRAGLAEFEDWIGDQLRTGLAGLSANLGPRCRRAAARLVDAKAGAFAARLDELPAAALALPEADRLDAVVGELGKLLLLARAYRGAAEPDPALRQAVVGGMARDELLADADAPRLRGEWEALGTRERVGRDGLIARATWLLKLGDGDPRFALLLDHFPASTGRRGAAFADGERFAAELVFFPAPWPLRAVIAQRAPVGPAAAAARWPSQGHGDPLAGFAAALMREPWLAEAPILLPPGRLGEAPDGRRWWCARGTDAALPLDGAPLPPLAAATDLAAAAALWDGRRLSMLAAESDEWGRFSLA